MKIVPFPSEQPQPGEQAWLAELEASLAGELRSPQAEQWRQLREDVRSLAPPMSPAFQARLAQELERRGALAGSALAGGAPDAPAPARPASPRRLALGRSQAIGAAVAAALVVALVIAVPQGSRRPSSQASPRSPVTASSPAARAGHVGHVDQLGVATPAPSSESAAPASAPGRVQQLGASITLGTTATNVQTVSDQVSQLATREGGYVQSSNVHVQQQGPSEATLALKLPSARLGAALAAIGRLAPVRAENQSLEDITNAYDAAHRQLSDALAERRALLRALAAASSEGQIDSLRERLASNRAAIASAQASVNAVSQRASNAEVEVSVLGNEHAGSEGLTLHQGLHDAGRVLVAALVVMLVAAAVLVPLALVIALLAAGRSAWRRHRRERVLSAP